MVHSRIAAPFWGLFAASTAFAGIAILNLRSLGVGIQPSYLLLAVGCGLSCMAAIHLRRVPTALLVAENRGLWLFFGSAVASAVFANAGEVAAVLGESPGARMVKQLAYLVLGGTAFMAPQLWMSAPGVVLSVSRYFVGGVALTACWGLYQMFAFTVGTPYPEALHNNISIPQGYWQTYAGIPRLTGFSGEPALFGLVLIPAVGLVLLHVLRGVPFWGSRAFSYGLLTLLLLVALGTTSFSAVGALVAVAVAAAFYVAPNRWAGLIVATSVALCLGALLVLTDNPIRSRLYETMAGESYSSGVRLLMWRAAWLMFLDNLAFGVGIGNFGFFVGQYVELPYVAFWEPMALLPRLLAETGLVGTAAFALFCFETIKAFHRSVRLHWKGGQQRAVVLVEGLFFAWLGALLLQLVAIPAFGWLHFWLLGGLVRSMSVRHYVVRETGGGAGHRKGSSHGT